MKKQSKIKLDPWHRVIKELVSVVCYQPEVPHDHKVELANLLHEAMQRKSTKLKQ